jgi:hypothetical protein
MDVGPFAIDAPAGRREKLDRDEVVASMTTRLERGVRNLIPT